MKHYEYGSYGCLYLGSTDVAGILRHSMSKPVIGLKVSEELRGVLNKMGVTLPESVSKCVVKAARSEQYAETEHEYMQRLHPLGIGPHPYGIPTQRMNIHHGHTVWPNRGVVMEYVPGMSLHNRFNSLCRITNSRAALLGAQLNTQLDDMHTRAGMVHGDVSPCNILSDASMTRVVLIDFELSSPNNSSSSKPLGKVAYRAPEQTVHDGTINSEMDQYSTAASIHTALVGEKMFYAEEPFPIDPPFSRFRAGDTVTPTEKRRRIDRTVDPNLKDILYKCLNINPGHRYPRCLDAAREFAQVAVELNPLAAFHPAVVKLLMKPSTKVA